METNMVWMDRKTALSRNSKYVFKIMQKQAGGKEDRGEWRQFSAMIW